MTERNSFRDYCEKTTSHGVQYFVMKRRTPIEKTFWIFIFTCITTITAFLLGYLINIWINNPSVMFIENNESSIHEIPFPSITICPSNQLRNWIWERYRNTNTSYWKDLQNYQLLTCSSLGYTSMWPYNVYEEYFEYDMIKKLVNACAISCSELFQSHTEWQNFTIHNFCQYIQPKLTLVGLCYSFNLILPHQMLNDKYYKRYMDFFSENNSYMDHNIISDWNLDYGYSLNSDNGMLLNAIPFRTGGISYYHRLRLIIHNLDSEFLSCPNRGLESSFLLAVNNPTEFYTLKTRAFIQLESFTKIQVTPFVRKVNKDLLWRSLETRKCYLHNERELSIFKQYSEGNCIIECMINKTISMCGCINYEGAYLVTTGVKLCGPLKTVCMSRARRAVFSPEVESECNCLPTCSIIEYNIADTFSYDNWTYMRTTNLVTNNSRGATVEIVFKNPNFIVYKTSSIFDFSSLISTIGGILSLFLGLNIINICEILYVLILMVYNYIARMFV